MHYLKSFFVCDSSNYTWGWNTRHPFAVDAVNVKWYKYHITFLMEFLNYFLKNLSGLCSVEWILIQFRSSDIFLEPVNFGLFLNQIIIMRFGSSCSLYCKLHKFRFIFLKKWMLQHLPERRPRMSLTLLKRPDIKVLIQIYHSDSLIRI